MTRRTPRPGEVAETTERIDRTVIRSAADPAVYATITPLGGTVFALAVHIDGEHPRVPEATILGRAEDVTGPAMATVRARQLVVEQADYRAMERGTLVRETVPREVARNAGFGGRWPDGDDAHRTDQVVEAWADERLEALDARYYDVHRQGYDMVVSFRRDDGDAVPAGDPRWRALDDGSGEVARSFSFRAGQEG